MNGISHKQAIQWIHRRLDGLLNESQLLALEEHLRSCDSCRAYAVDIAGLSVHLQNEFRRRWDEKSGPSQNVMEHVTAKARRIPVANRISSGVKLFAGATALIVLALAINFVISQLQSTSPVTNATETVENASLAENRLLAFTSDQNGNFDIYTMHADGSGLTNLTNSPVYDSNPFWSPDGKRIAFESDRDGFRQIYLMDIDGSNVVQLTKGEADHAFPNDVNDFSPWSPDGSRLLIGEMLPGEEKGQLYVVEVNGGHKTLLVDEPDIYSAISWSPDGQHIALKGYETHNTYQNTYLNRLYIVNADGSDLREITASIRQNEPLSFTQDYHWSPDGQSIFFVALLQKTDNWYWTAYEARLDDHSLIEHATTTDTMYGWWNGIYLVNNSSASAPFEWVRPDGTTIELNPHEKCQHIDLYMSGDVVMRSPNGNWVITGHCSNSDTWFYWANSDGTIIKPLVDSPISLAADQMSPISWSPDDRFITFTISSTNLSDMYILNVSEALNGRFIPPVKMSKSFGASWQPVSNNELVDERPSPEPTQAVPAERLIAFTSDQNGNSDIYTMRADGSGLTNITNNAAHDANPIWSPDGKYIAFESNRNGFMQIYLMDGDGSNVIKFTNDKADHSLPLNIDGKSNPWSPDGSKFLFLQSSSGGGIGNLYVKGIDGENQVLLGTGRFSHNDISWSSNGKYIAYVLNESATPNETFVTGIYVVDSNGNNAQELKKLISQNENLVSPYYWSSDGQSIVFMADKNDGLGQTVYEFDLESNTLFQKDMLKQGVIDWQDKISLVMERSSFVWQRSDGTSNTLDWDDPNCLLDVTRSLHGSFAIGAYCPDSKKFKLYWTNSDGSTIKQLLDSPALIGQLWDITWSPDDQYVAFNIISDKTNMYILDVGEALKDPSIEPEQVPVSSTELYTIPSWQPVPHHEIVEEQSVPEPTQISSPDGLIAFISEQSGNSDIYTMRADGSGMTNITNNSANDYSPLWSLDGQRIVFISERTGNADIFIMDPDGSNLRQLTHNPGHDGSFSWSPDGQKMVYLAFSKDDPNISQLMIMNADGSSEMALTTEPGPYGFMSWSPDGRKIVYSRLDPDSKEDRYYVIPVDGQPPQERPVDHTSYIHWEDSENFLESGWNGVSEQPQWIVRRFNISGDLPLQPSEVVSQSSPVIVYFENTYVVESGTTLAWYSMDGNPIPLKSWEFTTKCEQQGDQFIQETSHSISPDGTYAFVAVYCLEGTLLFYYESADGSEFKQLTDFSVKTSQVLERSWSPDGSYVIMTIANNESVKTDLYLFDIEKMLNDPSTQPIRLTTDEAMEYQAVWQPVP